MSIEDAGKITLRDFSEFAKMYQSDIERLDRRTARICMVIANTHKGKKGRPKREKDFMPKHGHKKQSWEQQLKVVKQIHKAFGGN